MDEVTLYKGQLYQKVPNRAARIDDIVEVVCGIHTGKVGRVVSAHKTGDVGIEAAGGFLVLFYGEYNLLVATTKHVA